MPDGLMRPRRSPIHECLRESTRADHLRLEGVLNLLDPELSRERYGRVLVGFHAFYAPLEAQLQHHLRTAPLTLDFPLPRRASLLKADLDVLGLSPAARRSALMPEINTHSEFAGRLYVVEGAALGGQALARHLAGKWAIDRKSGAAFFSGLGPIETGQRWARVLAWLERVAKSAADSQDMVTEASATFRALERSVARQVGQS